MNQRAVYKALVIPLLLHFAVIALLRYRATVGPLALPFWLLPGTVGGAVGAWLWWAYEVMWRIPLVRADQKLRSRS
jgi:hypothetical protein